MSRKKLTPHAYAQMTPEERLRYRTDVVGECWVYTGTTDSSGYGHFTINHKSYTTHRWAYRHFKGPTNGLFVLHTCDNPLCWRPDHLFLGTHQQNMDDMKAKGRNIKHYLTKDQITEILVRRKTGESLVSIAKAFGFAPRTISRHIYKRAAEPLSTQ